MTINIGRPSTRFYIASLAITLALLAVLLYTIAYPLQEIPLLNSTRGFNLTSENLTVYNMSSVDVVKNIIVWKRGSLWIQALNLPFEGGSNNTWTREYAQAKNGTVSRCNFTSTGGHDGKGAYQINSSGYINISTVRLKNWTFTAWIKLTQATKGDFVIAGNWSNDRQYILDLYLDGNSLLTADGVSWPNVPYASWNTNWHQYGVRKNATNYTFFVDGVVVGSSLGEDTSTGLNNFGAIWNGVTGYQLNGTLDDIIVYMMPISDAQVLALYRNKTNTIVSSELSVGDTWQACIWATNLTTEGYYNCSNTLTVRSNAAPTQTAPILNGTTVTNMTTDNLTVYNQSTYDIEGDLVRNIIAWSKDSLPFTIASIPFEGGSNTTHSRNYGLGSNLTMLTPGGVPWSSTQGYGPSGAYNFNGTSAFNFTVTPPMLALNSTISVWIKTNMNPSSTTDRAIVVAGGNSGLWFRKNITYYTEDGGYCNATKLINNNQWHHIVGVSNHTHRLIYIDGALNATCAGPANWSAYTVQKITNVGGLGAYSFNGTIDEIVIYNASLTDAQVLALYRNMTNTIVSAELANNTVWRACITPNDGSQDGITSCSNPVNITMGTPPSFNSANITPSQPRSSNPIGCSANFSDAEQANLTVNFTYYANGAENHTHDSLVSCLADRNCLSGNTFTATKGENWSCSAQSFDSLLYSNWSNSTQVTVLNSPPSFPQGAPPILNSSSLTDKTWEDLSCFNRTVADTDPGDAGYASFLWELNGGNLTYFSVDFNSRLQNTTDLVSQKNATAYGDARYLWTGGYGGSGAYNFSGVAAAGGCLDYGTGMVNFTALANFTITGCFLLHPLTGIPPGEMILFNRWLGQTPGVSVEIGNANHNLQFVISNGTHLNVRGTTGAVDDANWHCFATRYEQGNFSIFLDGVLNDTKIMLGTVGKSMDNVTNHLSVGCAASAARTNVFNGTIDNIQIWDYPLTDSQVYYLFQNRTNVINDTMTNVGDNFTCYVTVTDREEYSETPSSNTLTINNNNVWIQSNGSFPANPAEDSTVFIYANVSGEAALSVNFTVIAPNGSRIIDNVNATDSLGGWWNSSAFSSSAIGVWSWSITAYAAGSTDTSNGTFIISPWQIVVGNVTGGLTLDSSSGETMLHWDVYNFSNSKIFAADSESVISFSYLVALSRNTTGAYNSTDFNESDILLGMENMSESIYINWTGVGTGIGSDRLPRSIMNLTIFGKEILDIPVIDSTNTSLFRTGILWDSSDSVGDSEYDTVDAEDIVFVTKVSQQAQGQYGIYDFELRIPALLRKYRTTDASSVSIYAEIT